MANISSDTKKLINAFLYAQKSKELDKSIEKIHVDEVSARAATFYEKVRGIIDWKEEHLMRRSTIRRILKRKIFLGSGEKSIAESLVRELIKSGHFANDSIPYEKIREVQKVLDKYTYILDNASNSEEGKLNLTNWISDLAACEIEEVIDPSIEKRALLNYMYRTMKERIKIVKSSFPLTTEEINTQIYIAVHKALFKLDEPIISYHLLKRKFIDWKNLDEDKLKEITLDIYNIWREITEDLNHKIKDKVYQLCEKYDTPFLLVGDVLLENSPADVNNNISDPEYLENKIRAVYQRRLGTLKSRLGRAAFYSTLSIFTTNLFSLLVVEIPLAKLITGDFSLMAMAIDILAPTFLMFILVKSVSLPSSGNLEKVLLETTKVVYERKEEEIYNLKLIKRKKTNATLVINLFYFTSIVLFFSIIGYLFNLAGFPITSFVINVMFLTLIAFAGMKIRDKSKELTVGKEKETVLTFLGDIFFLPVVGVGRWLSEKWKKYNVISAIFNILIDAPFSFFVEFIETWRNFLRDKRDEIN